MNRSTGFYVAAIASIQLCIALGTEAVLPHTQAGEVLYNGIVLSDPWPPEVKSLPRDPIEPPYLRSPPAVIPIDIGRQLFVDEFLIASTSLQRTYHRPTFYESNPVLVPTESWEKTGRGPMAIPHSGGVWFDPQDQMFKMWYITGYQEGVGLAYSKDGLRWHRPSFSHVLPDSNMVYGRASRGSTIWLHHEADAPSGRFVMFSSRPPRVWLSADGIHWGGAHAVAGKMADRTTLFWNPFRQVWVYSVKTLIDGRRARRYWETPELVRHHRSTWPSIETPALWVGADSADLPRDDLQVSCQLYALDCVAYESLLLGTFIIWRGDYRFDSQTDAAREQNALGRPKQNAACIGFSRDGFHWSRPDRRVFLPKSQTPGDWNWGNSQVAAGSPMVVGDQLYFYVAGRGGLKFPGNKYQDAGGSTGVAFLRRDGFASMDADSSGGTLTTRPVRFSGQYLFVNVDCPQGQLRIEILDSEGKVILPYSMVNCTPISVDSTRHRVKWQASDKLADLVGQHVRFRFHLERGALYAFWVSAHRGGASGGYVGAGGPGFTSNRDLPAKVSD